MSYQQDRYLMIRNATLVGVISNILLSIIKLIFGLIGHSQALIADGLHSLSDLISDGVVLVAAKYSTQEADANHPYGHARFETLATVAVGFLLLIVAIGMLIDVGWRLFHPERLLQPNLISLVIAVLSLLVKEGLYQYTTYIAKRVRSKMLQANAWHHRSDAISSIIVFLGIVGTMMGVSWLDGLAAIGVSFMIAHIGWSLGWGGMSELVDTGLEDHKISDIEQMINSVDGVRTLHDLRTRYMGANVLVDVHILVNPRISVSEGHQIGETVRTRLIEQMDEIADVLVHVDPENDEKSSYNADLPLRQELIAQLQECWQPLEAARSIEQITLHYLSGRLSVDIYLSLTIVEDITEIHTLSQRFIDLAAKELQIDDVRVYYR